VRGKRGGWTWKNNVGGVVGDHGVGRSIASRVEKELGSQNNAFREMVDARVLHGSGRRGREGGYEEEGRIGRDSGRGNPWGRVRICRRTRLLLLLLLQLLEVVIEKF